MALYIISNRLPLKARKRENNYIFERSEGGLATGLASLNDFPDKHWIGWPGVFVDDEQNEEKIRSELLLKNFHPVFLSQLQIQKYYDGYSNSILWPLCHYFYTYIHYDSISWDYYKNVNRLFCDEAIKLLKPGDSVWVQDYQLLLLPGLIREKLNDISIGYFHHIPFPSYELFRVLPERVEILKGLMGADLIGFHTHDYMRHFISAAYRVLGLECELDEIHFGDRLVRVDAFPMGINYELHYHAIMNKTVRKKANLFRKNFGNQKLILAVDRLDYSKGILHRLRGFELFLEKNPEYREKVSLVMVVVPSRGNVEKYAGLKTKIDNLIGSLNGRYSSPEWTPVYYFYRGLAFKNLMALYHIADIALVTPLRDGMNLVAKEYVAVKRDNPGVLILSEMAGAAIELSNALVVNPNDTEEIEKALLEALRMPESEQKERMGRMQKIISRQTVNKWAGDFIKELNEIRKKNVTNQNKKVGAELLEMIKQMYDKSQKRLIILDYDGTLVPIVKTPELAIPGERVIFTLKNLASDTKNTVIISSGRDAGFLDKFFGEISLNMAAEHGAFFKENGEWKENSATEFPFESEVPEIIQHIVDKTPRSSIEIKKNSMVWHFRNCDKWLAELRQKQLINALMAPCARHNLQIMRGNKVIEVKTMGVDKGSEALRLMGKDRYDFIMAMGDDVTDEEMFHALPEESITIKIGSFSEHARFSLPQTGTLKFLNHLAGQSII